MGLDPKTRIPALSTSELHGRIEARTRSLQEKVQTLTKSIEKEACDSAHHVTDSIESMRLCLENTTIEVGRKITETIEATTNALNLERRIREDPLPALGLSFLLGILVGSHSRHPVMPDFDRSEPRILRSSLWQFSSEMIRSIATSLTMQLLQEVIAATRTQATPPPKDKTSTLRSSLSE